MKRSLLLLALVGAIAIPAQAQGISAEQTKVINRLIAGYAQKAKAETAGTKRQPMGTVEFSADTGRAMYLKTRMWDDNELPACSACHTLDPTKEGTHAVSKKPIKPLAPASNLERFADARKVEKNFAKHCMELYDRDCTTAEKGHLLTYLMSAR